MIETKNPFELSFEEIKNLIDPSAKPFPELDTLLRNPEAIKNSKQMEILFDAYGDLKARLSDVPVVDPEMYEEYKTTGKRDPYLKPYEARRKQLSFAVLLYLLGQKELKGLIEKYIIEICNESTWVPPMHDGRLIDLFSAKTGFTLATIVHSMGAELSENTLQLVSTKIEEKIFTPYLEHTLEHAWYKKADNWNAVCNSKIACTFLLLEKDPDRKAVAIKLALDSLKIYLDEAFEEDGGTTEGVKYWNYGMNSFVNISEMLYAVTNGQLNLLDLSRIRLIATFPSKVQMTSNTFASFSDSSEEDIKFHPGMIQRLFERTGEKTISSLMYNSQPSDSDIISTLRFLLWWNGEIRSEFSLDDAILPFVGIARMVSSTLNGEPIILAIKAGHNGENHNHNDIGSFILNVNRESLLVDPGPGDYNDKDYFSEGRYKSLFANSYGHSVPRINKALQALGKEHHGTLNVENRGENKTVEVNFSRAYDIPELQKAIRRVSFLKEGVLVLEDQFETTDNVVLEVEEVFITRSDVEINDNTITIKGRQSSLELVVENSSDDLIITTEDLENGNGLKRISFLVSIKGKGRVSLRILIK